MPVKPSGFLKRRLSLPLIGCCCLLAALAVFGLVHACITALQYPYGQPPPAELQGLGQGSSAAQTTAQAAAQAVALADLVISIPTDDQHLPLVAASRAWRQGLRTLVAVNSTAAVEQHQPEAGSLEQWRFYPDDVPPRGLHPGDSRAALAPYLAHQVFGDTYKWVLYGDDDTAWFVDGVLQLVQGLDPDLPYFITDNMWWSSTENVIGYQPNPEAPRCLPCGFQVPDGAAQPFPAPSGCPCTPSLLCQHYPGSVFGKGCDVPRHPQRTYSMHGGAGGLLSIGLMRVLSLPAMEACIDREQHAPGGDAFATICLWQAGFAHSDPGTGFSDPSLRLFDPIGGDSIRLLEALQNHTLGVTTSVPAGVLHGMVSAHVRSRTSSILEASALQEAVAAAYRTYKARSRT